MLLARLDGSFDAAKFEDGCRQLMGNRSYMLYTLDKARLWVWVYHSCVGVCVGVCGCLC